VALEASTSELPAPERSKASKIGSRSRRRGAAYERRIAKLLTDKFGVEFKRTPMSGGWTPVGDITPKDPSVASVMPFVIECKKREAWRLEGVFTPVHKKTFLAWMAQAEADVAKAGGHKVPMVILTKNLYVDLAMMRVPHFEAFFNPEFKETDTALFWKAAEAGFFVILPFADLLNRYRPGSAPEFEALLPILPA
jgi:Holliday junction resolvase